MISWVCFCFSEKESTANNHSTRSTLPCVVGVCVDCPVKDWEFEVIKVPNSVAEYRVLFIFLQKTEQQTFHPNTF